MHPEPAADSVVITGMGLAASLGLDVASVWNSIAAGRVGLGPVPAVESPLPDGSTGGQAPDLPPTYHPELPREARYLRWAVEQAMRDAGGNSMCPPERRWAVLGTTLHGIRAGGRFLRTDDPTELRAFLANGTLHRAIEGLGIRGGASTTCSACSSSLGAVALGVTLLQTGQADLAIAGGYDAIGEYVWAGFNSLRLVSPGAVRPFARGREGMKVAEGFGIVILERESDALSRGARIRARVRGWGESADAHHLTQPHPQGAGAARAMREALDRAGVSPGSLDLIVAHATATPDNDAAEYLAYRSVFEMRLPETPVVGFKSYLGHTLGGAGAIELILAGCALGAGYVPPCANVAPEEVEFPGLRVAPPAGLRRPLSCSLNTSLGFGGANTCIVLGHPSGPATSPSPAPPVEPEVWITGIGLILPGITSPQALLQRLGADEGPLFAGQHAAVIDDAQLSQVMNIRRARRFSTNVKLLLAAATSATRSAAVHEDAGLLGGTGAILASMHGSSAFCCEYYTQIVREGPLAANPVLFAEGVPNAAAAHLSATLGLRAGCQTIIGSRTAGLDALGLAALRIRSGANRAVLVGASEETHPQVDRAYEALVSRRTTRGLVSIPGGVAMFVESSLAAKERNVRPLARICGYASASLSPRGPAGTVGCVLRQLGRTDHVIGSRNGTWIDRAEALAVRALGRMPTLHNPCDRLGELYSAGPLVGIAWALADGVLPRFASMCTDFVDAASGVMIERLSPDPHPSPDHA